MSFGERRKVRDISGTQVFQYLFASISASASFTLDIAEDKPTWKKYLPFNSVTITNNGGTDVMIYINQDLNNALYVPSGTIKNFTNESFGIWSLKVTNLNGSTATTSNQLVAEFERVGMTTNKFVKNLAERFGSFL